MGVVASCIGGGADVDGADSSSSSEPFRSYGMLGASVSVAADRGFVVSRKKDTAVLEINHREKHYNYTVWKPRVFGHGRTLKRHAFKRPRVS